MTNIEKIFDGPDIHLPNKQHLKISHQGNLPLHNNLPPAATKAFILPALKNESLLSVGQLCDNNCTVEFGKFFCDIKHKNKIILKGKRNFRYGLYDINLPNTSSSSTNKFKLSYVIQMDKTKSEMAQYLHAALFSPCIKTLQQAIYNGNLLSWPIEHLNFDKLLKTTVATEMGHLDQERKYLNPTQSQNEDINPPKIDERTNNLFLNIVQPLVNTT